MTQPLGFTRRQFLGSSLAVVSSAMFLPTFLEKSVLAAEASTTQPVGARPGVPEDRILVVIQMAGGNDGLNTVVPYGMDDYYKARPEIGLKDADLIKVTGNNIMGLNATMMPMREMMEAGMASAILGVGYPNPNRSHFASMDIWNTADLRGGRGLGWVGKALDEDVANRQLQNNHSTSCIALGRVAPLATEGRLVKPIAFENPSLFRWAGSDLHPALGTEYNKMNRAGVLPHPTAIAPAASQADFIMRTALDAQLAGDKILAAINRPALVEYPKTGLGYQLKQVGAMIRAGLPTRVYYVIIGGFDTHANQPQPQNRLLGEFTAAVKTFYSELKSAGQQDRVLTLAFSEFGRRVEQNASRGTDHGTAGPSFLFGPMVAPGILGTQPSLAKADLDQGDLIYNADFRALYATVLDQWMKIDSVKVLGERFPVANILNEKVVKA